MRHINLTTSVGPLKINNPPKVMYVMTLWARDPPIVVCV